MESNPTVHCGGANFRFDELSEDHGIIHFVIGTSGIQNPLLVKSGNSGFLIFQKMENWGICLGMFWWSNRLRLRNLSLIYEIMKICEKKLGSISTGIPSTEKCLFCQNWDNVVAAGRIPVLKKPIFFHRSSLFHRLGLSS